LTVLQLRAFAPPDQAETIEHGLAGLAGVRHVILGARTAGGMVQLTGELDASAADAVLELLRTHDLAADDVTLWRASSVQPLGWRRRRAAAGQEATVWAEVLGRAHLHARPGLTYLLYMAAAGVIAGVGVLTTSSILVVGAMAISPDLLPISAASVGIVQRRWRLARRAIGTLAIGLAVTVVTAAASTWLLRALGRIDGHLSLSSTALGLSITEIGPGTVLVALAAGMAGMLAYETAGSAAVGVAISVTTIPAAAYLGATFGLVGHEGAGGAFEVLLTNVAGLLTAGSVTVWVQLRRRAAQPSATAAG
jgi:uncharacterized hydrophobic protein (TIGR00271 family)